MKNFCTNKYLSLNIFNYVMFFANIGFILYIFLANKNIPIMRTDIIFVISYYYVFFAPILIIILLVYLFKERKIHKEKNTKVQNIITIINCINNAHQCNS